MMTCSIKALSNCLLGNFRGMLGADQHRIDPLRAAIAVFNRYLGFAVRAQPGQGAVLTHLRQAPGKFVRQVNGHRHQGRQFRCRHSRTSSPGRRRRLLNFGPRSFRRDFGFQGLIHAHGNIA